MSHPEVRSVAEARCRDVLAAFDRPACAARGACAEPGDRA